MLTDIHKTLCLTHRFSHVCFHSHLSCYYFPLIDKQHVMLMSFLWIYGLLGRTLFLSHISQWNIYEHLSYIWTKHIDMCLNVDSCKTRINSGSSFIINYETMPFCFLKSMHTNTFLFLAIIINTTMNISCFIHEFVFCKHLFVYLWIYLKPFCDSLCLSIKTLERIRFPPFIPIL